MEDRIVLSTVEKIKALSDPYRYKILMAFYKKKQPATVKEIATYIDEVPANVHYHVKKMEKAGILKLIYTKEIKGIIAKYYEPTAKIFDIQYPDSCEMDKNLLLCENQRMISQIYDDSKNTFNEQLAYYSDGKEKAGKISMEDLYLTDEEANEFESYIIEFMNKHNMVDRNKSDLNMHHCFFSLCKIYNK